MLYEENSDEDGNTSSFGGLDGTDQGEEAKQKYRGMDKDEIYRLKMNGFIRLLQDLLNPAEV